MNFKKTKVPWMKIICISSITRWRSHCSLGNRPRAPDLLIEREAQLLKFILSSYICKVVIFFSIRTQRNLVTTLESSYANNYFIIMSFAWRLNLSKSNMAHGFDSLEWNGSANMQSNIWNFLLDIFKNCYFRKKYLR